MTTATVADHPSSSTSVGLQKAQAQQGDVIEARVVLTIKNKLKQKLADKIEDQWEYFVNGIGQGILVQIVSQEIDPGN